jgi:hypothetical protein
MVRTWTSFTICLFLLFLIFRRDFFNRIKTLFHDEAQIILGLRLKAHQLLDVILSLFALESDTNCLVDQFLEKALAGWTL